jgi:hypothetical protein
MTDDVFNSAGLPKKSKGGQAVVIITRAEHRRRNLEAIVRSITDQVQFLEAESTEALQQILRESSPVLLVVDRMFSAKAVAGIMKIVRANPSGVGSIWLAYSPDDVVIPADLRPDYVLNAEGPASRVLEVLKRHLTLSADSFGQLCDRGDGKNENEHS